MNCFATMPTQNIYMAEFVGRKLLRADAKSIPKYRVVEGGVFKFFVLVLIDSN